MMNVTISYVVMRCINVAFFFYLLLSTFMRNSVTIFFRISISNNFIWGGVVLIITNLHAKLNIIYHKLGFLKFNLIISLHLVETFLFQ